MNFTLLKSIAKNSFVNNFTRLGGVPNPIDNYEGTLELDSTSGFNTRPSSTKLGTKLM